MKMRNGVIIVDYSQPQRTELAELYQQRLEILALLASPWTLGAVGIIFLVIATATKSEPGLYLSVVFAGVIMLYVIIFRKAILNTYCRLREVNEKIAAVQSDLANMGYSV